MINQWNADSGEGSGTLLIRPYLNSLRIVSKGAQQWVLYTGNSHVDLELVLAKESVPMLQLNGEGEARQ